MVSIHLPYDFFKRVSTMNVNASYQTLRRLLGELGILLPLVLFVFNGFSIESSISHYYYTQAGTIFTSILVAFGLFLFTYRGHKINKIPENKEWISDNGLTNIGGVLAVITALIPTAFGADYQHNCVHLLCHNERLLEIIHLLSAVGFLGIMGGMAFFKFTLSPKENGDWRRTLYKAAGLIVWGCIGLMAVYLYLRHQQIISFKNGIFWGETMALVSFGTAWLVKGRAGEMWILQKFQGRT